MQRFLLPSLRNALRRLGYSDDIPITLEEPRHSRHGDLSTGIALELAASIGQSPLSIAERIMSALEPDPVLIESIEIAAPGFINIRLKPAAFHLLLADCEKKGEEKGEEKGDVIEGIITDIQMGASLQRRLYPIRTAYARIAAILRFADALGIDPSIDRSMSWPSPLIAPVDLEIIRSIVRFNSTLDRATPTTDRDSITTSLLRLAAATHALLDTERIVTAEASLRDARLRLISIARMRIEQGMTAMRQVCDARL